MRPWGCPRRHRDAAPATRASAAVNGKSLMSEIQFQAELDVPRRADGGCHHAARRGIDVGSRRRETGGVGQVENFGTELQTHAFVEHELLEEGEVKVLEAVFA